MYERYDQEKLSVFFQDVVNNIELAFQIFNMFPLPIEVFTPDGTSAFINRAMMELNGIQDASLVVGKYNILTDPVFSDQMNLHDLIQRAFKGEAVNGTDFSLPIQDLVDRGVIEKKPYEAANTDFFFYPAWTGKRLAYVICVFVVKTIYQDKPKVAQAREYIDTHWRDEFDPNVVAKAAELSVSQLYNLFKLHTGMTPGDYHKQVKVNHIKEALADKNLTIAKAFATCGVNSRSTYARVFKEITGLSPREYRANL